MIRTRTEISIEQEHMDAKYASDYEQDELYDLAMEILPYDALDPPEVTTGLSTNIDIHIRYASDRDYIALNIDDYLDWRADENLDELEPLDTTLSYVAGGYRHVSGRLTTIIATDLIPRNVILGSSGTSNRLILTRLRMMNP